MKYLCLIYADEARLRALAPEDVAAAVREGQDEDRHPWRHAQVLAAGALQPSASAAFLRVRNGQLFLHDRLSLEQGEQLGGFSLLEARDFNEALQLAARLPAARLGTVELRAVQLPPAATDG